MLQACIFDFKGNWDERLHLIKFVHNNSYQQSINKAPFEALYKRVCRIPICWDEVGERIVTGPKQVHLTSEAVKTIREQLRTTQSRQKSYANKWQRLLEFNIRDMCFLKYHQRKVFRDSKKR